MDYGRHNLYYLKNINITWIQNKMKIFKQI